MRRGYRNWRAGRAGCLLLLLAPAPALASSGVIVGVVALNLLAVVIVLSIAVFKRSRWYVSVLATLAAMLATSVPWFIPSSLLPEDPWLDPLIGSMAFLPPLAIGYLILKLAGSGRPSP